MQNIRPVRIIGVFLVVLTLRNVVAFADNEPAPEVIGILAFSNTERPDPALTNEAERQSTKFQQSWLPTTSSLSPLFASLQT